MLKNSWRSVLGLLGSLRVKHGSYKISAGLYNSSASPLESLLPECRMLFKTRTKNLHESKTPVTRDVGIGGHNEELGVHLVGL